MRICRPLTVVARWASGQVHELGGLESQGFTLRSANVLKGAPPSQSQFSVTQAIDSTQPGPYQITETPAGLNAVAKGEDKQGQTITDVIVASSGHTGQAVADLSLINRGLV